MGAAQAIENRQLEALEGEHVGRLRSDREMADEHGAKVLDFEAGQIRKDLLERMNKEKGVISEDEKKDWRNKLEDAYQDVSRLRSFKDEFEEHWQRSIEMRKKFDVRVHGAEDQGMLRKHEHEGLDEQFTQSKLEEKERMLKELEQELEKRNKQLSRFYKLEKVVQAYRRDSIKEGESYDEKLEILEALEKENERFSNYHQLFKAHEEKIGKKTRQKYYAWFLSLSEGEQRKALSKTEKDDITPRVEAYDIHASLPKEYQNNDFKEWGLKRRLQYLGEVERRLDREWGKALQEGKSVLAEKSIRALSQEYEKATSETGKRLQRKINFQTMLAKQIEMEKKLWTEFEKLPEKTQEWLNQAFTKGDFLERTELLRTQAPKLTERYTKALNKMNNRIDPHVSELYRERFDSAKSIEDLEKVVAETQAFQTSKNKYFKQWNANAKYFRSDRKIYEQWYEESIQNLEAAQKAEHDLEGMITARKKVYEATQKLPPSLRARMQEDAPLEKREMEVARLHEVARAYQSTIPFLLKNAEDREKGNDWDGALKFYMEALKLDPGSIEIKTLAAYMRQKGGHFTGTTTSEEDRVRTQQILKQVQESVPISEQTAELARQQILLDLSKKHAEHVGATGTTTLSRAKASLKNIKEEDRDTAQTIMEEHGDKFTVDETGTIRKKMKVKASGQRTEEIERQMGRLFDNKIHKGKVAQSGLSEVAFMDDSGREMERGAAEQYADKMRQDLETNLRTVAMTRLKGANVNFSEKQLEAIEAALDFKKRTEDLEEKTREAI